MTKEEHNRQRRKRILIAWTLRILVVLLPVLLIAGIVRLVGAYRAGRDEAGKEVVRTVEEPTGPEEETGAKKKKASEEETPAATLADEAESVPLKPEVVAARGPENDVPVTLAFAGDIYLSEYVLSAYDRAGGVAGILDGTLRGEIGAADLFIANEEFPFSDRGSAAKDKQFTFRLPTSRAHIMTELGADVLTLANNHTIDYGRDALLDTCSTLDGIGILHTGAGKNLSEAAAPVIVERRGRKIGILAASRVIPVADWAAGPSWTGVFTTYDPAKLLEKIRETKAECDFVIVCVHWGLERHRTPEAYQRDMGRQYIDAGADLVVGSHPHVLQGIEYYKGKPIFYSMGNFIFGSSIPSTMLGIAEIGDEVTFRVVPAAASGGTTRRTDPSGDAAFYGDLESISAGIDIDEEGNVRPAE